MESQDKIIKSIIKSCCLELKKNKHQEIINTHLVKPIMEIIHEYTYPYILTHMIILAMIVIGVIVILTVLLLKTN